MFIFSIFFFKAKKLIEDFYGLNELEYEKDDEDDEIDKDKELLSSLKRKLIELKKKNFL